MERVGLAEPVARRHRELPAMAVLAVAAETVAMAETKARTSLTVVTVATVAMLDLVVPAAQPHLEQLDQVVPADRAVTVVTVATVVLLATAVTAATGDLVVPEAMPVMQRLELTALLDLAVEPEMVATVETVEPETPAQMLTVAGVVMAAKLVQQAPEALTDSPVTAATAVPADLVGPELMEVAPLLQVPQARVLLAV